MSLIEFGWTASRDASVAPHRARGLAPARVVRADRERFTVVTEHGLLDAQVAGAFRHRAVQPSDFPAIGDWVVVAPPPGDGVALIHEVLPRTGVLSRRAAGEVEEEQLIAANVDLVMLVCGLDGDFNPRRVERFLAAVWEGGAQPVVVLNKADAHPDPGRAAGDMAASAPGVPVVVVSALRGDGIATLAPWLAPGRTIALLGSSGAGKSTLVNRLLGESRFSTTPVRGDDARGRHTTTHREIVKLEGGALLVDGPGVRELALWDADSGLASTFPDVEALAARCRFGDCRHEAEPGCAVREGLASGGLPHERFASWRKLQRELRAFEARHDVRVRLEEKRVWRQRTKDYRKRPDKRR